MDHTKRQRLEAAGWRFGDAEDFLELDPEEKAELDHRLTDRESGEPWDAVRARLEDRLEDAFVREHKAHSQRRRPRL